MNELAMMEWLVIAIVFAAGITGCVLSEGKEVRAARTAQTVVRTHNQSGEGK